MIIMARELLLMFVVCIAATGCAIRTVAPAPKPEQDQSAGVGLFIELRAPVGWPTYRADGAYFVKLDGKEIPHATELVASNYRSNSGSIYLLNAPPGDYAVVAAYFTLTDLSGREESSYTTYFRRDLVELTRVSIEKGHLTFGGKFEVDMSVNVCPEDADDIQLHYANVLSPTALKCGLFRQISEQLATNSTVIGNRVYLAGGMNYYYRGSPLKSNRDDAERRQFLDRARSDLSEAGWTNWLK